MPGLDHANSAVALDWPDLVGALHDDVDVLVERTVQRMMRELGSFAELDADDIRPIVRGSHERLLDRLRDRRSPAAGEDGAPYLAVGELRASQGVTVDDMLAAWRFGLEELRRRAHERVPDLEGGGAPLLLELIELAMAWADFGMLRTAAGHRQAELEIHRQAQHHVANLVRRVLFASASPTDLRAAAAAYGLDPAARYHAVRARPDAAAGLSDLERHLQAEPNSGRRNGLVALIEGDVTGFVARVPPGPSPTAIGISAAVRLHELDSAFRLATRALETALALGARGVFDVPSLGLQPAVLADHDVGQAMVDRYVAPLEGKGPSGRVVLQTVERYIVNDSRLEVTAQELGVHVNTVRYRLTRFEGLTGCSLRDSEALVEVWWALQRRRLA